LVEQRLEALFRHDARSRLVEINQWDGGAAPRFFMMRTPECLVARFRHDVADDLASRLLALARTEPLSDPPAPRPAHERQYLDLLAPVERIWSGPAFAFADDPPAPNGVTAIDETNADLLRGGFEGWMADVPHRRPFMARLEAGKAVSICASVRISAAVHCAGVETLPGFRGRGHAAAATAAWARAVRVLGAAPLYSTSWDNLGSKAVARRLGLSLAGVDFHVT
jgi:hypothetical protein